MSKKWLGVLVGGFAALGTAPAAAVTANVQVEGLSVVRAPAPVQTPASVNKDGEHSCPGNTAIGAIEAATAGNWSGSYAFGSYTVETLLGESHVFGSGAYWSIYLNNRYQNVGACQIVVADGDEVLVFASDDPFTEGVAGYEEPVAITPPEQIVPGQPFSVLVREAVTTFDPNTFEGTTELVPAEGATVAAGEASAQTGADGRATLTVAAAGPVQIKATKGNRAPDRVNACATDGGDGFCGTAKPGEPAPPAPVPPPCITKGDDGFCGTADRRAAHAVIQGIAEQQYFAAGNGPRELRGIVEADASGVRDVRLRLTRRRDGRCTTFDERTQAFDRMRRCGAARGRWFSAGARAAWSYLLPAALGRGRYVLDVEFVDGAGNRDSALARGRNRIVFHVG